MTDEHYKRIVADLHRPAMTTTAAPDHYETQVELEDWKRIAAKSNAQSDRLLKISRDFQEIARDRKVQADRVHQITMAHLREDIEWSRGMVASYQQTKAKYPELWAKAQAMIAAKKDIV